MVPIDLLGGVGVKGRFPDGEQLRIPEIVLRERAVFFVDSGDGNV